MKELERRIANLEYRHDNGAMTLVVLDDPAIVEQLQRVAELEAAGKPYVRLSRTDAAL